MTFFWICVRVYIRPGTFPSRFHTEPYVVYSDVLKLVADKLGANTEKLSIEDKGVYFTDECPGSDFQFNLKNNEDDVVYSVKVEGNRKEKNVDKTSGGVYVKGPKRK